MPPSFIAKVGLGLRRRLKRAADRIAPEYALVEDSFGFVRVRVLGCIAELGIADELARGPASAEDLGRRLELNADALHRVLRTAALYGAVRLASDGTFSLTRAGAVLRGDHPSSIGPWLSYMNLASTQEAYGGLAETIRTGAPSFPVVHGRSVWEHLAANPAEERLFATAMRNTTIAGAPMVVAARAWPESGLICDVAGGSGPLLAAILANRPGLRGTLVDAPGVLAEADAYLTACGVRDRVELVEGNMFERIDVCADIFLLKDILHDWDDERSLQILRTVGAAMSAESELVAVEYLQDANAPDPMASLVDIHMLTQCDGGRQRSATEIHDLMSRAGIAPGPVHRTATYSIVEGMV